ncbi:MAG TPA: glycosyltransferase family A protein [Gemmataceae bacterium]|nr:glycosyltransferase family A protein [Gemmataceae bacterium]
MIPSLVPSLSLIVPTRQRVGHLHALLSSLAVTAARPASLEVVLVIDADDRASQAISHHGLAVKQVIVRPGQTMGALNCAGYAAASGQYLMLLNDDVRARTIGWDQRILACFRRFPDGVLLVHPNDTVFQDALCTFPVVSRTFCKLAGGICPREYVRYRIDDHIEDVFNLLAVAGLCRTVYLPDVIFAHLNTGDPSKGHNGYQPKPEILALDGPRFDVGFDERKKLALRLLEHIERCARKQRREVRQRLEAIPATLDLRTPGRQLVQRGNQRPRRLKPPSYLYSLRVAGSRIVKRLTTSALGNSVGGTSNLPVSRSRSSR